MKPKEVLTQLWRQGFFRKHKSSSAVHKHALKIFHCTCSNWPALLSDCNFLRKEKSGWIQKEDFEGQGVKIVGIAANEPYTAIKKFETVLHEISGDVLISDPYLTSDCLDLLAKFTGKVKFLFFQKQARLSDREIQDFKSQNPHIELRIFDKPHLHDRYILTKDALIIIGHGLSLRNKETFIIMLPNQFAKDLKDSLTELFNRRWKEAKQI